jgi:hypothetical protein
MKKIIALASILCAVFAGAEEIDIQKQKAAAGELKKTLMTQLKAKISESPAAAVDFCAKNALDITKQVSEKTGMNIKRVSLKNRNPKNTPDAMDKKVLAAFEEALKKDKKLPEFATVTDDGKVKYYEPMVIGEMCVVCHGKKDVISKQTQEKIKKLYPADLAKGYEIGELRGVIVVW